MQKDNDNAKLQTTDAFINFSNLKNNQNLNILKI